MSSAPAVVGVVMGSSSDWDTLRAATEILAEFGIAHEARVVSAHRMPDEMFAYAEAAAGARPAARSSPAPAAPPTCPACWPRRRPCRCSACRSRAGTCKGVDSLYSIVQMPKGIPVATFAIGSAGAANAALFAVAMLAADDAGAARPGSRRIARARPKRRGR